jgi:hypothetical protein
VKNRLRIGEASRCGDSEPGVSDASNSCSACVPLFRFGCVVETFSRSEGSNCFKSSFAGKRSQTSPSTTFARNSRFAVWSTLELRVQKDSRHHFSDTAFTTPSSGTSVHSLSGLYSVIAPAIRDVSSPKFR